MTPEEAKSKNDQLLGAYKAWFGSPSGQIVLTDLAPFCRATESCFDVDERKHALAEGRREVWLHIMERLHLTQEEILQLRQGRIRPVPQEQTQT